mmetsp:Transcript_11418/g.21089  ORF Transcript_11418/g.21089 Transcript_11418/m.21089 type:complete len:359 (+) Transcript_11418:145-1221(+)|eukprot:CAMPEP_0201881420 /NCGR_PEP_ID=MMETSP0902-20130614/11734_1 /ASSEMBLY_ACC=CAM_ASM_000551 /TAXON_ID=420261 /ORGANISM="Thalassiosira antarctica, Strain CCMP982" /LENGTH=358 /DNA_ID=CAMNT_0048409631 /DNA_START=68 /DNA_END=1144 /DNA_ORIENTATION=+
MKSILDGWVLELISDGGGIAVINKATGERYEQKRCTSMINGIPHPSFIKQDVWEAQRSQLAFRSTDILVTTYSKCGTTLSEQVVCLLLNGGRSDDLNPLDKNAFEKDSTVVGKIWTEMAVIDGLGIDNDNDGPSLMMGEARSRMSVKEFDAVPSPRVLKSHEPTHLFLDQDTKKGRVLYVTRNPFDACVSCYYHPKKGSSPHSLGMPFEGFVKFWLSDKCEFGGWIQHTKGWRGECQNRDRENMLWISYEDLVGDPLESIQKIATFIHVDTQADPTLIQRVAEGCKFENVKKRAQASLDSGAQGNIDHLRKGKVGDWRNHFSKELFEEFGKEIGKQFSGVGSGLKYDIGGEAWALEEE